MAILIDTQIQNNLYASGSITASLGFSGHLYGTADTASFASTVAQQIALTGLTASSGIVTPSHQFTQSYYIDHSTGSYTAYTITNGDNGLLVNFSGSQVQTVTLTTSSIDAGWSAMFYQSGSGPILFTTASTSVFLRSGGNHSGSSGQYSLCSIIRVANGDFVLAGSVV